MLSMPARSQCSTTGHSSPCLLSGIAQGSTNRFSSGISALGSGLGNPVEQSISGPSLGSLLDKTPARELPRKAAFSKRGTVSLLPRYAFLENKRHVSGRRSKGRGAFSREHVPRQVHRSIEEKSRSYETGQDYGHV